MEEDCIFVKGNRIYEVFGHLFSFNEGLLLTHQTNAGFIVL